MIEMVRKSRAMNPIEQLRTDIASHGGQAETTLTPPYSADGVWFMDFACDGKRLTIEWSNDTGFGVSSLGDGYGERPEKSFSTLEHVQKYINEVLANDRSKSWLNL